MAECMRCTCRIAIKHHETYIALCVAIQHIAPLCMAFLDNTTNAMHACASVADFLNKVRASNGLECDMKYAICFER